MHSIFDISLVVLPNPDLHPPQTSEEHIKIRLIFHDKIKINIIFPPNKAILRDKSCNIPRLFPLHSAFQPRYGKI